MEYFEENLIPINLIRQYIFCPRIPWYKKVLQFDPPEQQWVKQGQKWHASQASRHQRRICQFLHPPYYHEREKYVISHKLEIHGYVDEIIYNESSCVLVEYKVDTDKPTFAQKMQIVAYALAAEESLKQNVEAVVILKGSATKQYEIIIDSNIKNELLVILAKLKFSLIQSSLPSSDAQEAKCAQCEYLRYCNDR